MRNSDLKSDGFGEGGGFRGSRRGRRRAGPRTEAAAGRGRGWMGGLLLGGSPGDLLGLIAKELRENQDYHLSERAPYETKRTCGGKENLGGN